MSLEARKTIPFLLGLFVILPFILKPFLIVGVFMYQIIIRNKEYSFPWQNHYFWAFCSIIFANIFGLIQTEHWNSAMTFLLKFLPYILLFFIAWNERENVYFFKSFKQSYIFSTLIYSSAYLLYNLYYILFTDLDTLDKSISVTTNAFYGFREHPIYLSIYLALAIVLLVGKTMKVKEIAYALLALIYLFILARKGPIIYLFIALFVYLIFLRINLKKTVLFAIVIGIIIIALGPIWWHRFEELYDFTAQSSTGIRMQLHQSALHLISEKPLLGYGTGDFKVILNNYIHQYTSIPHDHVVYNSHNEYFDLTLKAGLIGLIIFLIGQVFMVRYFIQKMIPIALICALFFYMNMLSESILERQNGILIFGIFTAIFLNIKTLEKT